MLHVERSIQKAKVQNSKLSSYYTLINVPYPIKAYCGVFHRVFSSWVSKCCLKLPLVLVFSNLNIRLLRHMTHLTISFSIWFCYTKGSVIYLQRIWLRASSWQSVDEVFNVGNQHRSRKGRLYPQRCVAKTWSTMWTIFPLKLALSSLCSIINSAHSAQL